MDNRKHKKVPYWLSRRFFAYLVLAVAAVAVFGALLLRGATAMVMRRTVEQNCTYLLERGATAYEANLESKQSGDNYNVATAEQELRTFAARLNIAESLDELPDWNVMCHSYFSRYWLLSSAGRVVRGDALPACLDREIVGRMMRGKCRIQIGNMSYASISTPFGTLVSEIKAYSPSDGIFSTDGNNDESNGFTFWVSMDGILYGWPGAEADGQPFADYCTETEALRTANGNLFTIDGAEYYCIAREMKDGSLLVAAAAQEELSVSILSEIELPIILFAAAALAVCLYALIMQEERATVAEWKPLAGKLYANYGLLAKLLAVSVGGTVFLVGLSWLTMTLAAYAQHNQQAAHYMRDITESAPYYGDESELEFSNFRAACLYSVSNLSAAIAEQPAMAEPDNLGHYADAVTIPRIYFGKELEQMNCIDARLYDKDGKLLATGKGAMNGLKPVLSDRVLEDLNENNGVLMSYDFESSGYSVIERMEDGSDRYVMLLLVSTNDYIGWLHENGSSLSPLDSDKFQLATTAAGLDMGRDGKAFVVSQEKTASGKEILALVSTMPDSYSVWIDEGAMADYDGATLREGYAGEQTIGGTAYYVNVISYQMPSQTNEVSNTTYWILYAVPSGEVAVDRLSLLIRVGVTGFLVLLVLALLGSLRFGAPLAPVAGSFTDRAERRTKTMNGHRVNGPIMGWGTKSGWGAKTPEEKFSTALGNLAVIVTLAMVLVGAAQGSFSNGSLIDYIMKGDWDRELNVFSCTYVVLIFLGCFSISWVARGILGYVSGNLGPRSETMGRLFNSLIKYATYLAAGMYLLYDFGVNASVLLASAGLLTLVLSPTLNMLLGDVSAGIFIVFEDEYRVGDIVNINGYRGVVLEITLRTTHIEDLMGNVKVFNNSKITEVENLSQEYTTAVIQVGVQYEDSLDHIENVLRDELPKLGKIVPNVVGTPTYEGVDEFGDSCVLIRIHVISREEHRCPMERRFRHELKMMFDRRGINVPYAQIVLHDALAEAMAAAEADNTDKPEKETAAPDAPADAVKQDAPEEN